MKSFSNMTQSITGSIRKVAERLTGRGRSGASQSAGSGDSRSGDKK